MASLLALNLLLNLLPALLPALLLAAPEKDPAKDLLRIAWASQYEWKEDGVKNATVDFEWKYRWTGTRPEDERKRLARGTLVIVDGKVVRIHVAGANRSAAEEIRAEMSWVLNRFHRESFEERFKEQKFSGPETISGGRKIVRVGQSGYLIKDDRIVGYERNFGTKEKPFRVRIDATVGDLGEGYAILAESYSYERDKRKSARSTNLKVGEEKRTPVPSVYRRESATSGSKTVVEIQFSAWRLNAKDPIVLNPALRDAIKAAWEQRYRIPAGTRIDAQWERKPDTALTRARWTRKVNGELQLLDGKLEVILDDKLRLRNRTQKEIQDRAQEHLQLALDLVLARPFDEEFAGCGFDRDPEDDTAIVILGHPKFLAVRIEKDLIAGYREDFFGEICWSAVTYKKARDGTFLTQHVTRKIASKKKWKVSYRYARKKDLYVPKLFEMLVSISRFGQDDDPDELGVLSYELRKLSVKPPE